MYNLKGQNKKLKAVPKKAQQTNLQNEENNKIEK